MNKLEVHCMVEAMQKSEIPEPPADPFPYYASEAPSKSGFCAGDLPKNREFPFEVRTKHIRVGEEPGLEPGSVRIWVIVDRYYVRRETRKVELREVSCYSSYASAPGAEHRDICCYCGADTTDIRVGYDCASCGSN